MIWLFANVSSSGSYSALESCLGGLEDYGNASITKTPTVNRPFS